MVWCCNRAALAGGSSERIGKMACFKGVSKYPPLTTSHGSGRCGELKARCRRLLSSLAGLDVDGARLLALREMLGGGFGGDGAAVTVLKKASVFVSDGCTSTQPCEPCDEIIGLGSAVSNSLEKSLRVCRLRVELEDLCMLDALKGYDHGSSDSMLAKLDIPFKPRPWFSGGETRWAAAMLAL